MNNFTLEQVFKQMKELLEQMNIDIDFEISLINQYDDADNYEVKRTSNDLPIYKLCGDTKFEEWEKIFQLGEREAIFSRVSGEYREFLCRMKKDGYSYSFVIIHFKLCEYLKVNFRLNDNLCTESKWKENFKLETYLDYVIYEFLYNYRNNNKNSYIDILNGAGNKFIYQITQLYSSTNNVNIHNDINILSALKYEKSNNYGNFILVEDIENFSQYLNTRLLKPIFINEYKKIRKLFEIAINDVFIVGNTRQVVGFITKETLMKIPDYDVCIVKIYGPLKWEIFKFDYTMRNPKSIIQYKDSCYLYEKPLFDYDKFNIVLKARFSDADTKLLSRIIEMAVEQRHGTTVVIADNAESEAKRLKASCFSIEPMQVSSIMKYLTAIDGAILCDIYGKCHAIGVILDGMCAQNEDISHGARHNSAKRYKTSNKNCVIVVVSEDGNITPIY